MDFPLWFREICDRLDTKDESLENLNLNIRRVDRPMMEELSRVVHKSPSLVVLNLTSSIMEHPDALFPLAEHALARTSSLQILHLSYNQIQNTRQLGSSLATNGSLVELYLDYNAVNSKGALHIAEGLRTNKTLSVLQMNNNSIKDEGAIGFAQALAINRSLRRISLIDNDIHEEGGSALKVAMDSNESLHVCHLHRNSISPVCTELINLLCCANKAGRQLVANPEKVRFLPYVLGRSGSNSGLVFYLLRMNLHVF